MKKAFIIFCFISFAATSFAQKIILDKSQKNSRLIQTEYYPFIKKGLSEKKMSLVYFKYSDSSLSPYSIIVRFGLGSSPESLPKGYKVFVKLDNGEIIEGYSLNEIQKSDNKRTYNAENHSFWYDMYPEYSFSTEDILKMIDHTVVKIRFQITWDEGYYDYPSGTYKEKHLIFSKSLAAMKSAIDTRIAEVSNPDDLLKGF